MTLAIEWCVRHALLAIANDPIQVVEGPELPPDLFAQVAAWVSLNRAALAALWHGQLMARPWGTAYGV